MGRVKVERATPQIKDQGQTPEDRVKTGNGAVAAVQASTGLAGAADVQAKLKDFATANTNLDANNKSKQAAKVALDAAVAAEAPLVRRWGARKRALLSAIEVFGDGSTEVVNSFNVGVTQRTPAPTATVPTNLRPMKVRTSRTASVRWDPVEGADGYVIQYCTNPNDATTSSQPIHVSEAKYHLGGQTPGATLYFRVLAEDPAFPNGQTPFSAWVPVIVSP